MRALSVSIHPLKILFAPIIKYLFSTIHIYSPEGRKFRSRNELRQYLEKHNLEYNAEDFDFSIWGRGNRPASKTSNTNINNNAPSPGAAATSASPNSSAASDGTCFTTYQPFKRPCTFWHSQWSIFWIKYAIYMVLVAKNGYSSKIGKKVQFNKCKKNIICIFKNGKKN